MIVSQTFCSTTSAANYDGGHTALDSSMMSCNTYPLKRTCSSFDQILRKEKWPQQDSNTVSYMEFYTDLADSSLLNFSENMNASMTRMPQNTFPSNLDDSKHFQNETKKNDLTSTVSVFHQDAEGPKNRPSSKKVNPVSLNEAFRSNLLDASKKAFPAPIHRESEINTVSKQLKKHHRSENLPDLSSTSLFLDLQKQPKHETYSTDDVSLDKTTKTATTTTGTTMPSLTTESSDASHPSMNVHAEDQIVPALKNRLETFNSGEINEAGVLENSINNYLETSFEYEFPEEYSTFPQMLKPKRSFLKKGSRKASTLFSVQPERTYQYYSNAVARKFGTGINDDPPLCHEDKSKKNQEQRPCHRISSKQKSIQLSVKRPWNDNPKSSSKLDGFHVKNHGHKAISQHQPSVRSKIKGVTSDPTQIRSPTIAASTIFGHTQKTSCSTATIRGEQNATSKTKLASNSDASEKVCADLEFLRIQAQAKMAIMEEQMQKLNDFQKQLESQEKALKLERERFNDEMDRQRLQSTAERETELLEIEKLRIAMKRDKKKHEANEEALEHMKREKGLLEDKIRRLRISLSEQEEEFKKREERYRKVVDRLNSKVSALEWKVKAVTHDLEQRLRSSAEQKNLKHSSPRQLSTRSTASTSRSFRSSVTRPASPTYKKKDNTAIQCHVQRLTQSTPATATGSCDVTRSSDLAIPLRKSTAKIPTVEEETRNQNYRPVSNDEEDIPLSHFQRLLEFDLKKAWVPFDDALLSLRTPQAMTLQEAPVTRPDGRQEFLYNDGHREIIFVNGMRKAILKNGWVFTFFSNGDIRGIHPSGILYYYFHSDTIYSITQLDGTVFNSFVDGQVDCRLPDSTIQVRFPGGLLRQINPDGTEYTRTPPALNPR